MNKVVGIRLNTRSKRMAFFLKKNMEKKTKYPFNLALSTRSYLFLDFDCPSKSKRCLNEARKITKAFSEKYNCYAVLYETPNGFHAVIKHKFKWRTLKSIIAGLIEKIDQGKFKYLDRTHLKAGLERGYLTLRNTSRALNTSLTSSLEPQPTSIHEFME